MLHPRLTLASISPRRAEILRQAGFEFDIHPVQVDERLVPGETAAGYVARLARLKALAASRQRPGALVLGADTAVVVGGDILGKPADELEAEQMIRRLSGRAHEVLTGVCLRLRERALTQVATTTVHVTKLSEAEIGWYANRGEGRDKAGAYAIQGLASRFITRIEGSYANVVGLPIATVYDLLKAFERDVP